MKTTKWLLAVWVSVVISPALAISEFDIEKELAKRSASEAQPIFDAFSEDLASALSYKALTPAEPLGGGITLVGFDIGLEVTATELAQSDVWAKDILAGNDLSLLPLPKLHAHFGFPFGVDIGAVYVDTSPLGTNVKYLGGEVRYSFVSGNLAIPAVALRGTFTSLSGVDKLDFSTKSLELTISKGFLMLTPYAGIGNVWATSDPDVQVNGTALLEKYSFSVTKWFVGLNLNLGLLNFAFETDKTGEAQSYSGKLGFRF